MNKEPFFSVKYKKDPIKIAKNKDIIVKEIKENIIYDKEKNQKIICYEVIKINLTKKINETAKLIKERNAEIFDKLTKLMEK